MPLESEDSPPKLLLVEGKDDAIFIATLCQYHKTPPGSFEIQSKEGITNLLKDLPLRLTLTNQTELGIIVDADSDFEACWMSLRNILVKAGYANAPLAPESKGTIVREEDKTTVGIWIMPDNTAPGILEDFIRFLVPPDDTLWARAEKAIAEIPAEDRLFSEVAEPKARLHTWLAWQEEPGRPIGQAITNKALYAHAPQAQILMDWLRRLFSV